MRRTAVAAQFRWKLHTPNTGHRDALAKELGIRPLTAQLLGARAITSAPDAASVLDPSLRSLPDPKSVPGFADALATLEEAVAKGHKVLIHGDYDVDGTCGSVLLHRLMRRLGLEVEVFIPDRIRDGYSFSDNSLEAIDKFGAKVVIAVDNGTTAFEPLAKLADAGIQVIVVDHHLPGKELPRCAAMMNPWVGPPPEEGGIFQDFCGTAVAWLLTWGVLRHLLGEEQLPEKDRRFLFDSLGYAAIATIGDVMPLRGPNRAIVQHGLATLRESSFPGLRALLKTAGIRKVPTAEDVGFRIGPRLNAAGRMFQAEFAFRALATDSAPEAEAMCAKLEALNVERREVQNRQMEILSGAVEEQFQRGDPAIFTGHSEAHFGVLGIVANQVMERTGLPTLLWAECAPGVARGSARAPEGCHLMTILDQAQEFLQGYGGHARAAGFHFDPQYAPLVAAALRDGASGQGEIALPELAVDSEISPGEIDLATLNEFDRLQPYGEAFPEPAFLCTGTRVVTAPRFLGDGSHVELRLERDGEVVRCLGWRLADRARELQVGDSIDVVVKVGINDFRGRREIEWTLRDFRSTP